MKERGAVVWLLEMHQLVDNNVVDQAHGQLQQAPVEQHDPVFAARAPAETKIPYLDAGRACTGFARQGWRALAQPAAPGTDVPAAEMSLRLASCVRGQAEVGA